jgi:integrase
MAIKLDIKTVTNLKSPGRYTDALVKGLHIWVKPNLRKYWIFRFNHAGKQHNISLGGFPALGIADARLKAQSERERLESGINPAEQRKLARIPNANTVKLTKTYFRDFAFNFVESRRAEWTNQKHGDQWVYTLEEFAFPVIGDKALDEIETEDILAILEPIWVTKTETAARLRGRLELILAAATTRKLRSGMNPALWRSHLDTILSAPNKLKKGGHHKALPYEQLSEFIAQLRQIDKIGAVALEFLILNASRTGEVIGGLREEVNGDVWIIPAARMKAKKEHRVPLCKRSLELLDIAKGMDLDSKHLFSRNGKPITNMAMPMMLRRLGIDATVHGFRSSFRDWVSEETEFSPEIAEMALAHTIQSKVERAYRRKDLLERRRVLMNAWESYCLSKTLQDKEPA